MFAGAKGAVNHGGAFMGMSLEASGRVGRRIPENR